MDPNMQDALPVLGILGVFFFVFIIMLIPTIFYMITLQKTLASVQEKNRAMSPGMVWLNLIPLFALGWHFYIVAKVKESLSNEYSDRGLSSDGDFGYKLGLTMCILAVCGVIPFVGGLASLACLVVWILYWVKISGFKKELESSAPQVQVTDIPQTPETPQAPETPQPEAPQPPQEPPPPQA